MGSYATLYLGDFDIASSKSSLIAEVMTVFVESDREISWRNRDDDRVIAGPADPSEAYKLVEYRTTARIAAERLDVMGFTIARCRREFDEIRREELEGLSEYLKLRDDAHGFYAGELTKYEGLTYDNFAAAFIKVFDGRLRGYEYTPQQRAAFDSITAYILDDHDTWPHFGFLCHDIRCFLRMALSIVPPETSLRQDLSDLIHSGWISEDDPARDDAVSSLLERYPENAPRIVLTEGASDAEILRLSLAVLFPHLVGYYTFFDFHGSKAAGGAGQLISVIKAFGAAGVANRVIAVLDNDTAAHEACRGLRDAKLPANVAVVHYPERDWLRAYPTLGPSGEVPLDINGKGASIEIYLGRDVLLKDGQLCPIQWAGYSQAMRAYQGEVVDKSGVIERWKDKLQRCTSDRSLIVDSDWDDLRAVWSRIIAAFAD